MVYNFFLKFRKIFIFNSLGIKKKGFIKFKDKKCDVLNSNEGFLFLFIYLFLSLGMKNVLHGFMQIFGIKTKNVAIFYN